MNLAAIFPDEDYRFAMRFERRAPEEFFTPQPGTSLRLDERRRWLDESAADYAALAPQGQPLLAEMFQMLQGWPGTQPSVPSSDPSLASCIELGKRLDTDFLLVRPDSAGSFRLEGGCVCFPSSWSLPEKMGSTLEEIHGVVPGLNPALSRPISGFLAKLAPDIAWLRANWGLSRSPELNQHPHRGLPRLDAAVGANDVWVRIEHQALVALPCTKGVLFGIRIEVIPLPEMCGNPSAASGLWRALETMPEAVAAYKGIAAARPRLIELLRAGLANP
ncbi:MAG: hypothetical protein QOF48_724 [Verrucomicrobiota bacterium]|jgi:hypothetical protein